MSSERRHSARRILYSPEYLDMGADNGGVVVDLSEGGLRFQAVGRVEPESDVMLSFSLGTGYRIDVEARVVWVSEAGNSGGVVFKKLPGDSRSLIREWISKPESEQRANAAVSTPDDEEEDPGEEILRPVEPPERQPSSEAQAAGPSSTERSLAREAFDEGASPARVDEIPAPDDPELRAIGAAPAQFAEDIRAAEPETYEAPAQTNVSAQPISPRAAAGRNALTNAPFGPRPFPTRHANAVPVSVRPNQPPKRASTAKATSHPGASFSAAPSISTWGGSLPGSLVPERPNPLESVRRPFPPRSAENIFARDRWAPPQFEGEPRRDRKLLLALVIIVILIVAAMAAAAYTRAHRGQIGAVIERVGNTVAGQPAHPSTPAPARAPQASSPAPVAPQPHSAGSASTQAPGPQGNSTSSGVAKRVNPASSPDKTPQASANANPPAKTANSAPVSAQPASQNLQATPLGQLSKPAYLKTAPAAPASASAAQPPHGGLADYARAQKYLTGSSGVAPDPATAAEWFWRSLEAGDTDAALPLADLYLHGEGVSQSCTQARVLLDAAVRKGNAQAARKLAQLPENCD